MKAGEEPPASAADVEEEEDDEDVSTPDRDVSNLTSMLA